jgi:pilus assembly protein Flp/PilA
MYSKRFTVHNYIYQHTAASAWSVCSRIGDVCREWQGACWFVPDRPGAGIHNSKESEKMNDLILKMYIRIQTLMADEDGQDLVEYALVVALIAFGAVTGMKTLTTQINKAFNTISSDLNSAMV